MKPTVTLILDKRRQKQGGKYPLKIKVYYKGVKKKYGIGMDFTEEEYTNIHKSRNLKKKFEDLLYFKSKAEKIVNDNHLEFSFDKFEALFYNSNYSYSENNEVVDVFTAFENYIKHLRHNDQIRTADSYLSAFNKLRATSAKKRLAFTEVTPEFLKSLENKWLSNGISYSTIGIYTRYIRCLFNVNKISRDKYPFGTGKYIPPSSRNIKKALSLDEIKILYEYQSDCHREKWARDMWFFSYLCNGMNFKDISLLKWTDINFKSKEFSFYRSKTKTTKAKKITITIIMNDEIERIINYWGNKKGTFVFNILQAGDDSVAIVKKVSQFVKTTNKYLKRISEKLELSRIVTTNYARHSFSTVLKRAGVDISMISEQLGHSNIKTTEIYLDSFEKEQKKEAMKSLLSFKESPAQ